MLWIVLSALTFVGAGFAGLHTRRARIKTALIADGFASHEIKKALRLYDRKGATALEEYCRTVLERRIRDQGVGEPLGRLSARDWTKAESYKEVV